MKKVTLFAIATLLATNLSADDSQLYRAAMMGDLTTIKSLTNGDIRDTEGRTPLYIASCHGQVETIKYLLGKNYDINAIDSTGSSALMCAIWNNQFEVAKYLIDSGADLNVKNRWGNTALKQTRFKSFKELEGLLILKGAKE